MRGTNYFPTGIRPSIRQIPGMHGYPGVVRGPLQRIRGMSGLGAVDWSTCASTRPDPDDPTHFQDCLDANGNVIDSRQFTPPAAAPANTIFGYDSTLVIGVGAAVALVALLATRKKGR